MPEDRTFYGRRCENLQSYIICPQFSLKAYHIDNVSVTSYLGVTLLSCIQFDSRPRY
jgi:hypothetical protein